MEDKKFELLDFKVTDLVTHVNTAVGTEMTLHAESRIGSQTPQPADGTLYLFLNIKISDGDEGNYLFDITTVSVIQLPQGMTDIAEEDKPACVDIATAETHRAIKQITENMGMVPLDLDN